MMPDRPLVRAAAAALCLSLLVLSGGPLRAQDDRGGSDSGEAESPAPGCGTDGADELLDSFGIA